MRRFATAVLLCVAVTLTAVVTASCSGDNGSSGSSTTGTTTGTAMSPTPVPERPDSPPGQLLPLDPSIMAPHPIPFTAWTRTGDDRLVIHFETGSPECYGIDAKVTETADAVTIRLLSGTKPAAAGKMCTMIAIFAGTEIYLKAPLGTRKVLSEG